MKLKIENQTSKIENRELIILAHYVCVGASSSAKSREILDGYEKIVTEQQKNDPKFRFHNYVSGVSNEAHARVQRIF